MRCGARPAQRSDKQAAAFREASASRGVPFAYVEAKLNSFDSTQLGDTGFSMVGRLPASIARQRCRVST